jgi:copper chaperone NosL
MKRIFRIFGFAFLAASLLPACSGKVPAPVSVNEAADTCAACGMTVRNNGFAAELLNRDGQVLKFDDAGCLLRYFGEHPELKKAFAFVQDRNTREWVPATEAFYVTSAEDPTPMGSGIHAYGKEASAAIFAKAHPASVRADWQSLSSGGRN